MKLPHNKGCSCKRCFHPKNVTHITICMDYQEQYIETAEANKPEVKNENDKGATAL